MKSLDLKLKNLANLPTEKFLVSPMNINTLEFHIKYKHGYNKGGLVTSCTDVTIKSRKYIFILRWVGLGLILASTLSHLSLGLWMISMWNTRKKKPKQELTKMQTSKVSCPEL